MVKESSAWAKLLGKGLAQVQNLADEAWDYGFHSLKSVGTKKMKKPSKKTNKYLYAAEKAGRGVAAFIGELGEEYFDKYEEIKAKKKQ